MKRGWILLAWLLSVTGAQAQFVPTFPPSTLPPTGQAVQQRKTEQAQAELEALRLALEAYYRDNGQLPTQEQGLQALGAVPSQAPDLSSTWRGPYLSGNALEDWLTDPWGKTYRYAAFWKLNGGSEEALSNYASWTADKQRQLQNPLTFQRAEVSSGGGLASTSDDLSSQWSNLQAGHLWFGETRDRLFLRQQIFAQRMLDQPGNTLLRDLLNVSAPAYEMAQGGCDADQSHRQSLGQEIVKAGLPPAQLLDDWNQSPKFHRQSGRFYSTGQDRVDNTCDQPQISALDIATSTGLPAPAPLAPVLTTASTNTLNLAWRSVPAGQEYRLLLANGAGSFTIAATVPGALDALLLPTATTLNSTLANLACGTGYQVKVQAIPPLAWLQRIPRWTNAPTSESLEVLYSRVAASASSPVLAGTTVLLTSPSVLGLSVTATSPSSAGLTWSAASGICSAITGFQLERGLASTSVFSVSGTAQSYTDSGLACGSQYSYRLQAISAATASGWTTPQSLITPIPTPPAPRALVNFNNPFQLEITWQASVCSQASLTDVQCAPGGDWSQAVNVGQNLPKTQLAETWTLANTAQSWQCRVRHKNALTASDWSSASLPTVLSYTLGLASTDVTWEWNPYDGTDFEKYVFVLWENPDDSPALNANERVHTLKNIFLRNAVNVESALADTHYLALVEVQGANGTALSRSNFVRYTPTLATTGGTGNCSFSKKTPLYVGVSAIYYTEYPYTCCKFELHWGDIAGYDAVEAEVFNGERWVTPPGIVSLYDIRIPKLKIWASNNEYAFSTTYQFRVRVTKASEGCISEWQDNFYVGTPTPGGGSENSGGGSGGGAGGTYRTVIPCNTLVCWSGGCYNVDATTSGDSLCGTVGHNCLNASRSNTSGNMCGSSLGEEVTEDRGFRSSCTVTCD